MFRPSLTILSVLMAVSLSGQIAHAQEVSPTTAQSATSNDPKIVEQIRGDYVLRSGIVNGNKMTTDRITDVSVKITDKTITTYDGQRQQRFSAAYTWVTDKRPWHVTLKSVKKVPAGDGKTKEKIEQSEGIIDISEEGARVWLAYSVDGTERPKDFKGGNQQNVFELERLKTP